ncbi:hypothetical protein [Saccharicrinis sp. 156]|uniref:hypothetical protein n=1 Tax=Saccharicrinis sp. 156 TaxID=3417574 RepID=UPI003D341978
MNHNIYVRFVMYSLIIGFFLTGCTVTNNFKGYETFKKSVSPEVFKNFPIDKKKIINDSYVQLVNFPTSFTSLGHCGLFMCYKVDSVTFKEMNKLSKSSVANLDTSCVIKFPSSINKPEFCTINYIVPNISDSTIDLDSLITINTSNIHIFNSGDGKYIDNEFYEVDKETTKKHGFSSGVFVENKSKTLLYWILIW